MHSNSISRSRLSPSPRFATGGVRTGGYPKAAPIPGPLGCQRPGDWDLLWSPARLALKALPAQPGQLVSAVPGMMSLTRKRKLSLTLKQALGEQLAFGVMPTTFSLPDEIDAFRRHLASEREQQQQGPQGEEAGGALQGGEARGSSAGEELWILKTAQHLGKGLKLVTADEAVKEAGRRR